MSSIRKAAPHTATGSSEYVVSRQAQAFLLAEADRLREEKRRAADARIDTSASKWRYSVG